MSYSGEDAILGPEIYSAIAEREKKEILVAVVLTSIDEVCRQKNGRCVEVLPISKFHESVLRSFRAWLVPTVGV